MVSPEVQGNLYSKVQNSDRIWNILIDVQADRRYQNILGNTAQMQTPDFSLSLQNTKRTQIKSFKNVILPITRILC